MRLVGTSRADRCTLCTVMISWDQWALHVQTDVHYVQLWYLEISGHFTCRPMYAMYSYDILRSVGTSHADRCTLCTVMISHWSLLRMKNTANRSCKEKWNILCSVHFFWKCAIYEIMWKNMIEPNRWQYSAMHAHCMLDNSGYRHSEYVILAAFPQQHILHRHSSLLCLYICCLSCKLWQIHNRCAQGVHGNALTGSWRCGRMYMKVMWLLDF